MVSAMGSTGYFGPQRSDNGFNTLPHEMSVRIPGTRLQWFSNVLAPHPAKVVGRA